ncbi:fibronectin type III domain-containing protein, partial [Patescibacteria group bacterium]|nr:fibronectin type III domain-containing protein [Patescibacteria group bacterium]
LNTSHSYPLTGLTKGTTYHLQLRNTDANGNTVVSDDITFTTTDSSDTAPEISATSTTPIFDTIAIVNWDTNVLTKSELQYGVDPLSLDSSIIDNNFNKTHSLAINSLSPETQYYYSIIATNDGNATTTTEGSFVTQEILYGETEVQRREEIARAAGVASVDTSANSGGGGVLIIDKTDKVPPTISAVNIANVTSNSALISWLTDENTDAYVEFGLDTSYGAVSGTRARSTEHAQEIINLEPNTYYHYKISVVDASGNYSETKDGTFSTLSLVDDLKNAVSPDSSQGSAGTSNDATVSNKIQSAQDLFKLASQAVQRAVGVIKNNANNMSLNFMEASIFDQQGSINELASLLPVPIMSGSPAVDVSDKSATISWRTDKESSSIVYFASDDAYRPDTAKPYQQIAGSANEQTIEHNVLITGLLPNTQYHYQLESKPTVGAAAKSKNFSFITDKESLGIQKYVVNNISTEVASFQWVTSIETDSSVEYTPYKDNKLDISETKKRYDENLTTIHEIKLEDLSAGVPYRIVLSSKDEMDNVVQQVIDNFYTSNVDVAPVIGQVQTISAISPGKNITIQTVISWLTNEPSTTKVYYKKGVAKEGDKLSEETKLDEAFTKKHVVVITKFDPGSVYSFQTESIDYNGKVSLSKIYTILTPRQEESVFQVIVKNLEGMFGWVKQMQ